MKLFHFLIFFSIVAFGADSQKLQNPKRDQNFTIQDNAKQAQSITQAKNPSVMSIDEFIQRIEHNSIALAKSKAYGKALVYEGKAQRAWNSPYIDLQTQQTGSPSGGKELESEVYLMLAPRLPWVSSILSQMYQTRQKRQDKNYELTKRLSIISSKRLYLEYLAQKEQLRVFEDRLKNAKEQLDIAEVRYNAGRISKSQYLFFKSDYLSVQFLVQNSKKILANTLNALKVALGIVGESDDIVVENLEFTYLNLSKEDIREYLKSSLYLEIVGLDIEDYSNSAKFASRSRFDSVEIGVGANVAESTAGAGLKLKIPFPLTTKYGNQKAMYLALQSGSLRESEILQESLQSNALSFLSQLELKRNAIELARSDEENKRALAEISRIGYEAGKTSVFEYLTTKNNHLDSMITTIEAKKDYANTLSMLEESLALVLAIPNLQEQKAQK